MRQDAFVAMVCNGQPVAPRYFPYDVRRNHERRSLLDEHQAPPRRDLATVRALQESGTVLLDTRAPSAFSARHLRRSLNVGLEGRFAEYAGDVLRAEQAVVLVCDPDREIEAKIRLGRIGFDNVVGYLHDPLDAFAAHPSLTVPSTRLTAAALTRQLRELGDAVLVDVRNPAEVADGMIADATHIPLARLLDHLGDVDADHRVVVYCASGYRSSIAARVLSAGHRDVCDLLGGYQAWCSHLGATP